MTASDARGLAQAGSLDRVVTVGLAAFAGYHLALGLFMAAAPGVFFTEIGPFGPRNDHYIRDLSTYNLAFGVVLLVAAARRSWRLPVLWLTVVQFALHTVNHLLDIGDAEPSWVGPADFAGLLVATVLLVGLLWRSHRERRGATGPAAGGEGA